MAKVQLKPTNKQGSQAFRRLYASVLGLPALLTAELPASGFIPIKCPLHDDKTASAGFKPTTGYFNCYKCGLKSPQQFVAEYQQCTEGEALHTIEQYVHELGEVKYEDSFTNKRIANPKFDALAKLSQSYLAFLLDSTVDCPDITDEEYTEMYSVVNGYTMSRDISIDTLQLCKVGVLPARHTHWNRPSLVFPYYIGGRCYGLRYRDERASKGGEPDSHFTLWGMDDLSQCMQDLSLVISNEQPQLAIIMEGESDRLALVEALRRYPLPFTVSVVNTPTAAFRREWKREFQGIRKKLLIPQDDEASQKFVAAARAALTKSTDSRASDEFDVLELPWKHRDDGKDTSDWRRTHNDKELSDLIRVVVGNLNRTVLNVADFRKAASRPAPWLLTGILRQNQVAILGGKAKGRKTWFMLNMIRTLLTPGESLCGIPQIQFAGNLIDPDDPHKTIRRPCNILIVEEEGDESELYERASKVLEGTCWEEHTFWAHRLGFKLDDPERVSKLEQVIKERKIDVVFMDPFQRLHSVDENSASEMGIPFSAINRLTTHFSYLSMVILHHFGKAVSIVEKWDAFRGSSRIAGEVDLGIFIEKGGVNEPTLARICFDGRSCLPMTSPDGTEVFSLRFSEENGLFDLLAAKGPKIGKWRLMCELIDQQPGRRMETTTLATQFEVSVNTITAWVDKATKFHIAVEKIPASEGFPSMVELHGELPPREA